MENIENIETVECETEVKEEPKCCEDAPEKGKKKCDKKHKAEIEKLKAELEAAEAKAKENEDKYMRTYAEYDNFRRRSRAEKESTYADAQSDAVKELLPLIDNLQRTTAYTDAEKIAEGVTLILKTLPDVLAKLGIECYGEVGETFDPNIHHAIMHEDNPETGENEITAVFQQGYRMGDKIIRYAMVTVAN